MGMDAKFYMWAGVKLDDSLTRETIEQLLPIELFEDGDRDMPLKWGQYMKDVCDGMEPEFFSCSEEYCGFGVKVMTHDWDYGVKEFDKAEFAAALAKAVSDCKAMFAKFGIKDQVKIWYQTDWA